jgi:predicted DNA-binding transcriptional regulator AlpA
MQTEFFGQDKLMDQQEVADMLGLSTKTLEYWRWKKVGPRYLKLGRLARYRMSDVMAYIKSLIKDQEVVTGCKGKCNCK